MKTYEFDIAIIGGGCIGSSILFELVRRGFRNVALIDKGRKTESATAKSGGMLRAFHENSEHVELALAHQRYLQLYQKMGVLTEKPQNNGHLYFIDQQKYKKYEGALKTMHEAGSKFEVLTTSQGKARFPQFVWKSGDWAIYEPEAGQLSPARFSDELITHSIEQGVQVFENFEVQRICPYLDQYRIAGSHDTVIAKSVILAGGARLLPRLSDLGINTGLVTRNLVVFHSEHTLESEKLPNYLDRETLEYGGFGHSQHMILSDMTPQRLQLQTEKIKFRKITGDDVYSPNRLGIKGQMPGLPRLFIATGWGGTGFKFSLEIGNRIARAVERDFVERRMIYAKHI